MEHIQKALNDPEEPLINLSDDSDIRQRIDFEGLSLWASVNFGIGVSDQKIEQIFHKDFEPIQNDLEPWWKPNPADRDTPPLVPWYTPARYFARWHIEKNPSLLSNRVLLAQKVAQTLTDKKIFKRGGKKPLDHATIKNAFTNIKFI